MDERQAYIALNLMEGVGPVSVRSLSGVLGSVHAIMDADPAELRRGSGVGARIAAGIVRQRGTVDWQGELARAGEQGIRIITPVDSEYPAPLKEIHDPPLALYVRGALATRDREAVAIVGTRRPTHYGLETAERLAYGLARAGVAVVSGLAEGIDTAAHRGALKAKGRTIAVIGSGMNRLYPPSNAELADEIAEQGAVLSEFPLDRAPDKTTFPMRNRIVSGLSRGVLVVEAGSRSGALITVDQALEQGRTVFAVPGRVDNPASRGPHRLIRTGATLVRNVDDVLDELSNLIPGRETRAAAPAARAVLTDDEERLLEMIEGEVPIDVLIRQSGLRVGAVSAMLIGLEMKRVVKMLPGQVVARRQPAETR